MTVPEWVQDAIFYQIFPDRFAKGVSKDGFASIQPWGAPPTFTGFQGGNLRGIIERFDHLLALGANAIYLNPIFLSPSTHRYNTSDYYRIDPMIGDMSDFRALLDLAHTNQVRVVLDGVFNHCGRGFFAFNDILENQDNSPYREWFHINHFPVDAFTPGEAKDYLAWWNFKSLPKFNTNKAAVRKYLLDVGRYWIEQGIDGWRLDVPNEINDDGFWLEFRQNVRAANPEAYLVGEIWNLEPRWVGDGHFDGLMNYPLRDAILRWVNGAMSSADFSCQLEHLFTAYPTKNVLSMYSLLGSHDTERVRTLCGGDIRKVMLAFLLLFSLPGAPAVYYGDEVGMEGGKDPDSRRAFLWDEKKWSSEVWAWIKKLAALRKERVELRRGDFSRLDLPNCPECTAFVRSTAESCLWVLINPTDVPKLVRISTNTPGIRTSSTFRDLIAGVEYPVEGEETAVTLPAMGGALLVV